MEYNNNFRPHNCDISYPFFCERCNTKLYHDKKIRTDSGKLIPIQFESDLPHQCPGKEKEKERNRNVDDV